MVRGVAVMSTPEPVVTLPEVPAGPGMGATGPRWTEITATCLTDGCEYRNRSARISLACHASFVVLPDLRCRGCGMAPWVSPPYRPTDEELR